MPTPVAAARQCLSPAAVTALDAAVASARRRAHAQTTSLHLISSLLAPPAPPLLRDALARARSAAYSPRVQVKALELCFAVSLDRLPSASVHSSSSSGGRDDEPAVSNSLMAAIKRSQTSQRRNPDTYHLYQQVSAAQAPAAVKVELPQLVLAILDDPLVSRVFSDAGFRSGDIKLAILRPAPPMTLLGRLPTRSRPPPLFLCSFATADAADVPSASPAGNLAGAGEDNCRRIAEILSRGRNLMLIGMGAASASADFACASPYRIVPVGPNSIDQTDFGLAAATASATSGLIISIGDLQELVSEDGDLQERGRRVVAEVTRVLETRKAGRVWVMGWSATYETYLTFLSKFPLVDEDWKLQLLPITTVRAGGTPGGGGLTPRATTAAAFSKPSSLMESFVPIGGVVSDAYEANSLTGNSCTQALRCQQCNDRYEQEVATIIRGSGITCEHHQLGGLPSLLQKGSMMGPNNGFDAIKVRDDQMVLNSKIMNLQKKWNEYCLRLHQGCQRIMKGPYQLFSQYIGVPTDKERAANSSKGPGSVELREVIKPSAVFAPHTNATTKSISSPSISNKRNEVLVLKQVRLSKSDERLQDRGMQSRQEKLANRHDNEDHASPSSAASVATDLVLCTPRESSSKATNSSCWKHAEDAERSIHVVPNKVDGSNLKLPQLLPQPYACSRSSTNVGQTSPSDLHSPFSGGMSAFGRPSHFVAQGFDMSNYKLLLQRLFKIVGRQEEALSAICRCIVQCKSKERSRGINKKNDIWFSFYGSDSMSKRRVAEALAEVMLGSSENLIYLDLSLQDSDRGKVGTDRIVQELMKKPRSVIFLDNIDEADGFVQDNLAYAIETGRFRVFDGKEVHIKDSIVVLSTKVNRGCKSVSGVEEGHIFCEEKILAARRHQLKILMEPGTSISSGRPGCKVVSPRQSLIKMQTSLYSCSVSKRKLSISSDQEKLQESASISKRLHRTSNVPFDLNVRIEEDGSSEANDDSSSNLSSSGSPERSNDSHLTLVDGSIDSLLSLVDGSIDFKPLDFGKLADDILQELSSVLRNILGSGCTLEIEVGAMEQILASAWASEDKRPLQAWLEQVFARSLDELKLKCGKHASSSTLRLVACEDTVSVEEVGGFGGLLPSRITLEW